MAKLGEGLKFKYQPIWEQAPIDMQFHYYETAEDGTKVLKIHEENFKLISNIQELKEFGEKCRDKVIGFDTETTGLSYGIDKIVGFSLSLDSFSGVYVPIRHKEQLIIEKEENQTDENGAILYTKAGKAKTKKVKEVHLKESPENLDPKEALDVLYDILISAKRVLAHNAEFDLNVLKFEGYDINKIKFFDTLILPYLFDPEATALAGLKALEKRVLGRTVPEFKEVLGKQYENFSLVAPKDGYVYACHDKETEVLTEHGWVKWEAYNGIDKLATINLDNDALEYQSPTKIYKYIYNGEMECCNSTSIDYCVTPNHNMVTIPSAQCSNGKITRNYKLVKANELDSLEYMQIMLYDEIITVPVKKSDRFIKPYNDYVYCAEVPNHTLITRRNGKTLVSGNCCDTSGVVGIYEKMYPAVRQLLKKCKDIINIDGKPYDVLSKDNQMVKVFVDYYGHCRIIINRQKAIKYKEQLTKERDEVVKQIYAYFDKGIFNLSSSSKEFKETMASKDIYTGVLTDKKQPSYSKNAAVEMRRNINKIKECLDNWKTIEVIKGKVSKKGLGFQLCQAIELYGKPYFNIKSTVNTLTVKGKNNEPVDLRMFWLTIKHMHKKETEKLDILTLIHRNNSLNKALNSYVDKLTQVDDCVMHYRLKGTKSGRLSSGNGSKTDKKRNQYYIDLNAQNLTKPASSYYVAEECKNTDTDEEDDNTVLGWKFTPVDKDYAMEHLEDKYIVEGQDSGITIRGCLEAPKGEVIQSIIPASEVADKEGFEPSTDEEVYEVEMDNGTIIKCCDNTVFKVKVKGQVMYMPFKDIKHDSNAEILEE